MLTHGLRSSRYPVAVVTHRRNVTEVFSTVLRTDTIILFCQSKSKNGVRNPLNVCLWTPADLFCLSFAHFVFFKFLAVAKQLNGVLLPPSGQEDPQMPKHNGKRRSIHPPIINNKIIIITLD